MSTRSILPTFRGAYRGRAFAFKVGCWWLLRIAAITGTLSVGTPPASAAAEQAAAGVSNAVAAKRTADLSNRESRAIGECDIPGLFINPHLSLSPPECLLVDAWYTLRLSGQATGYMRMAMRRVKDSIQYLQYMHIRIARGPFAVAVVSKTVTTETLEGRLLKIRTEQVLANQPLTYIAEFTKNGRIRLTIKQAGSTITRNLPAEPDITTPWTIVRKILTGKIKPGRRFTEKSYAFEVSEKAITVTHVPVRPETIELAGRKVKVWHYSMLDASTPHPVDVWCEPHLLIPVRMRLRVLDMPLEAVICTKSQALATLGQQPPEIFLSTLVKASKPPGVDPASAGRVVYRLAFADESPLPDIPQTTMQRIVKRSPDQVVLEVARPSARKAPAGHQTPPTDRLKPYLKATAYANCEDSVIRSLARRAAGNEKDPLKLARRLCLFVHREVKAKGLDVGFATASEVARSLRGDCTEHAVLLAALARALGIPARTAFGLVAVPGQAADGRTTTFGYHMWTQVFVGGRWLDLDPALGQTDPDPTHIALGTCDLSDASFGLESIRTFLQCAGKVTLQILSVEPRTGDQ